MRRVLLYTVETFQKLCYHNRKSQQVLLMEKLKMKNVIHIFGASGSGTTTLGKKYVRNWVIH